MKISLVVKALASHSAALLMTALCVLTIAGCAGGNGSARLEPGAEARPCEEVPQAKYIILMIGDGMQLEHEIAASRYLYGTDRGLSFHAFPYQTAVTTWDATTYDRYAWWCGAARYDAETFDALVGFNPRWGGTAPYPIDKSGSPAYFLTPLYAYGTFEYAGGPATDSASSATAMATGYKTDSGRIAWAQGDNPDGALETIAELMRDQKGASIGVASTVGFSHATPRPSWRITSAVETTTPA